MGTGVDTEVQMNDDDGRGEPERPRAGDGLLARAIQHEIDHLNGILFTDRLTSLDTLRKVEPEEQQQEAELVGV
jgi:peptide deformylase